MNECVNSDAKYYKNIGHLLTYTLNPFVPIFIFRNDMQVKETITSNLYGPRSYITYIILLYVHFVGP